MYGNNTIYHRGEIYEFKDETSALRCRLALADEDNSYAYPEGMGGTKVESTSYNNNLDTDRRYMYYSKPQYHNEVKTIEMPFLNKERDAIISTIKSRLKEIEELLAKL